MDSGPTISSEQVRAARALIRWEQKDLAAASKISLPAIKKMETVPGRLAAQARTVEAIRSAFEAAGVEFTNGGQPGVRFHAIDVTQRPDGTWGVKSVWKAGAPAEIVTPDVARDIAVAAQGRGKVAWGERVIAAAAKAGNLNNNLDENGTPKGWTIDPDEADKPA